MQTSRQGTNAFRSENLVYDLGTFTAKKVNSIWILTLILELNASTFQQVKGACSVIPYKGAYGVRPYQGE